MVQEPLSIRNGVRSPSATITNGSLSPGYPISTMSNRSSSGSSPSTSPSGRENNHPSNIRVIGVVLVNDAGFCCQPSTNQSSASMDLVLGSIILDRDLYTGDELRRLMLDQIPAMPRDFSLLSSERYPIHTAQESRLTSASIINEVNHSICIKQSWLDSSGQRTSRIGIVEDRNNWSLGFVFTQLSATLENFRKDVDILMKELSMTIQAPKIPEYVFMDNLGRPVLRSQEIHLNLLDLLFCSNVHITFLSTGDQQMAMQLAHTPALRFGHSSYRGGHTGHGRGNYRNSQKRTLEHSASQASNHPHSIGSSIGDTVDARTFNLPFFDGATISIKEDIQSQQENIWSTKGRGSRKILRKSSLRKKDIKIKTSNSKATHCVMLSYARNEAAQHALRLKEELNNLGIPTYLDVHEITSGTDWMDSLNNAVSNCTIFVPLVTPLYGNTQWTNREVKLADLLNKKIVPINFLDSWPPECLAIQFATTQYISWLPEDVTIEKGQLDGLKIWPPAAIKKIAKDLAKEVPKDKDKDKKNISFSTTSSKVTKSIKSGDKKSCPATSSTSNSESIVISGHPNDEALIEMIKQDLEAEGYKVWASCQDPNLKMVMKESSNLKNKYPSSESGTYEKTKVSTVQEGEDQIDRAPFPVPTPVGHQLSTIEEVPSCQSSMNTADYQELKRALSSLKTTSTATRPTSLPFGKLSLSAMTSPDMEYQRIVGQNNSMSIGTGLHQVQSKDDQSIQVGKKNAIGGSVVVRPKKHDTLKRMHSDVICEPMSAEKKSRLQTFSEKVASAFVVIVVSSKNYFKSQTSKEQLYYCETRRKMIVVKADDEKNPPWFTRLMGVQLDVDIKNLKWADEVKTFVRRMANSAATSVATITPTMEVGFHEAKIQYCVKILKSNIDYLCTCVYVLGSTKFTNQRSEEISKALGVALAQLKNVTLVTTGSIGAQDLVAKTFLSSLEDITSANSRIVHVLPMKDEKDVPCSSQNQDGHFEPMSYGKTLFIGESVDERQAVIPRLLDTCILIGGDQEAVTEANDFIWNDHFVIPVASTYATGAKSVVFERPSGVDESAWNLLSDPDAIPAEVAQAIVKVLMGVKHHIAELKRRRRSPSADQTKDSMVTKLSKKFTRKSSKKKLLSNNSSSSTPTGTSTPLAIDQQNSRGSVSSSAASPIKQEGSPTIDSGLGGDEGLPALPVLETDAELSNDGSNDGSLTEGMSDDNDKAPSRMAEGLAQGWSKMKKLFKVKK